MRELRPASADTRRWRIRIAGLLLLSLIGTSCAVATEIVNASTVASAQEDDPRGRLLIGGGELNPALLDGDVVLWFWAPECTDCRNGAFMIVDLSLQYPDITFIGVGVGSSEDENVEFIEANNLTFIPHLSTEDSSSLGSELVEEHNVTSLPSFVIIDSGGDTRTVTGWSITRLLMQLNWLVSN